MKKNTAYLYEGLTPKNKNSMMLWESAGRAIYEANLTPQQITQLFQQIEQGATSAGGNRTGLGLTKDADTASALAAAGNPTFESRNLSRRQVQAIFERVVKLNNRMLSEGRLEEGIWDDIKSGAGKGLQGVKNLAGRAVGAVAQKAQTVGHNLTTKTTADKLQSAWKAAGSPTDSAAIEKILQSAGVNPDVVKSAFQSNNIPLSVAAGASTGSAGVDPNEPMPDVMTPGGNRSAQGSTNQGSAQDSATQSAGAEQPVTATPLPNVSKLTPEQKKQLIAQIDTLLKTMPKPKVPYSAIKQPTANQPTGGANGPITPQSDPSAFPKVINGKAMQFEEQEYLRFKFLVDGIKARL